jgi:hypothetical protein
VEVACGWEGIDWYGLMGSILYPNIRMVYSGRLLHVSDRPQESPARSHESDSCGPHACQPRHASHGKSLACLAGIGPT